MGRSRAYELAMAFPPEKRTRTDGTDSQERKIKFNLEMKFRSVGEKDAFKSRLSKVSDLLTPPGSGKPIDNLSLLSELFDAVESRTVQQTPPESSSDRSTMSFMRDNGEYECFQSQRCIYMYNYNYVLFMV